MSIPPFLPTAPIANLVKRAELLRTTRAFFDERGFVEVQTPVLSRHCVIDKHLDPFTIVDPATDQVRYFQTSPEQGMKRLLAAGMTHIYQIGPVFRAGECGWRHNPEFTMLEWYRVGDGMQEGIQLLSDFFKSVTGEPDAEIITYQEAFLRITGIDPLIARTDELAAWCVERNMVENLDWSDDHDDWLDLIFSHEVVSKLGLALETRGPIMITHFPASQAALARISRDDPRTCERFELFFHGIELANGYHELLDAEVLRERNRQANAYRARVGKPTLPEENLLLDAMESGIPACTGCALGFDRLAMIASGTVPKSLDQVICFPWHRA